MQKRFLGVLLLMMPESELRASGLLYQHPKNLYRHAD
jgi:hypothetical protein